MIHFVVHPKSRHTLEPYVREWKAAGLPDVKILPYNCIDGRHSPDPGAYIFDSFERLTDPELSAVDRLWESLARSPARPRLLNHPSRALDRLRLSDALCSAGINDFRAFRIDEVPSEVKFPVFIRYERLHYGSMTPLIHGPRELREWIAAARTRARAQGRSARDLLVVEFVDTRSRDGLFRKYGSLVVGDQIVHRHLEFSSHWIVKVPPPHRYFRGSLALIEEELSFLDGSEHIDELRTVARIAGIDYGRIDYGFREGRLQVWEINMNPTLFASKAEFIGSGWEGEVVLVLSTRFERRLASALAALERGEVADRLPPVTFGWPRKSPKRQLQELVGAASRRSVGHRRVLPLIEGVARSRARRSGEASNRAS